MRQEAVIATTFVHPVSTVRAAWQPALYVRLVSRAVDGTHVPDVAPVNINHHRELRAA